MTGHRHTLCRMLMLPLVAMLLAISSVIGAGLGALPAALLGFVIGSAAGWQLEPDGAASRLPNGTIWLRGEWWSKHAAQLRTYLDATGVEQGFILYMTGGELVAVSRSKKARS